MATNCALPSEQERKDMALAMEWAKKRLGRHSADEVDSWILETLRKFGDTSSVVLLEYMDLHYHVSDSAAKEACWRLVRSERAVFSSDNKFALVR